MSSKYYIPDHSKIPVLMGLSATLCAFGAAHSLTKGTPWFLIIGIIAILSLMFAWFNVVIQENHRKLSSAQLKQSYVKAMAWFICSEVMFFVVFFGTLFYARLYSVPVIGGEGENFYTQQLLWQGFEAEWPLLITPDQVVNGSQAQFIGAKETMIFPGWSALASWLPLWNTVILLLSSVTVHAAHVALKANKRTGFNTWLAITASLGVIFALVQAYEYYHAYTALGLTLNAGIYGATFFMLTGFHGMHVCIGTIMLIVQLLRSLNGHFTADNHFGFEATSWYWHFVDVVWVGLFIFVYLL